MLKLLDNYDGDNIITNVEFAFSQLKIVDDPVVKTLMMEIDGAKFVDDVRCIDRFGTDIYVSNLSTGCKAAMCVYLLKDKVIDTIECGVNARDSIIRHCSEGSIIVYDMDVNVTNDTGCNEAISILYHGIQFNDLSTLNKYIEWGEYYTEV